MVTQRIRRLGWICACVTFVLPCGSTTSRAVVTANVHVSALIPNLLDRTDEHIAASGSVSAALDVEAYYQNPNFNYHGTGTASATQLTLGSSSQVILNNYTFEAYDDSRLIVAIAQLDDDITIAGSGPGYFEMSFHLSGNGADSDPLIVQAGVIFSGGIAALGGFNLNSFSLGYMPLGDISTGPVLIEFGVPFHIIAQVYTTVEVFGAGPDVGPIISGVYYGNTAAMTGVQVFDAEGIAMDSFSILSASGTDYLNIESAAAADSWSRVKSMY